MMVVDREKSVRLTAQVIAIINGLTARAMI